MEAVSGIGNFTDLQLQARPGYYTVFFEGVNDQASSSTSWGPCLARKGLPHCQGVSGVCAVLQAVRSVAVDVAVQACKPGQVVGLSGAVCDSCLPGLYSFVATNRSCESTCPSAAICPGGAVLYPEDGYFHSAVNSTLMHPCPNKASCG